MLVASLLSLSVFLAHHGVDAFGVVAPGLIGRTRKGAASSLSSRLEMAAVGIFYGTSTGSTQTVANEIYEALLGGGNGVAAKPMDIETLDSNDPQALSAAFAEHDALIVGTPTWNTGADTERSGTGWDELYYKKLPQMKSALSGKRVAVFGLGDQISYSDNYADATGELFDVASDTIIICHGRIAFFFLQNQKHKSQHSQLTFRRIVLMSIV
jgi:flavodoxin